MLKLSFSCQFAIFRILRHCLYFEDLRHHILAAIKLENWVTSNSSRVFELSLLCKRITTGYGLQTCVHCAWKLVGISLEGHGRFLRELMGADELFCGVKVGAGPDWERTSWRHHMLQCIG